mmetsp:Transcript_41548/g.103276  ORF Transcript_41548/g.103276 Transcript_41548/m.103276 type:complete len:260 (-) Transcript_41548:1316-2095(-)
MFGWSKQPITERSLRTCLYTCFACRKDRSIFFNTNVLSFLPLTSATRAKAPTPITAMQRRSSSVIFSSPSRGLLRGRLAMPAEALAMPNGDDLSTSRSSCSTIASSIAIALTSAGSPVAQAYSPTTSPASAWQTTSSRSRSSLVILNLPWTMRNMQTTSASNSTRAVPALSRTALKPKARASSSLVGNLSNQCEARTRPRTHARLARSPSGKLRSGKNSDRGTYSSSDATALSVRVKLWLDPPSNLSLAMLSRLTSFDS